MWFITLIIAGLAHAEPVSWQQRVELWGAGSLKGLAPSPVNPGNELKLPEQSGRLEARIDEKVEWQRVLLRIRPRVIGSYDEYQTLHQLRWTEASATLTLTDTLAVTYGLQNFQWGPAELASPSNRIFRETAAGRDFLFETRGRHLARVNFTPLQNWSNVLLAELTTNGEEEFEAETGFRRKALWKSEIAWNGFADYFGIVAGWREEEGSWLGQYGQIAFTDGLSFYADLSQQKGSQAWRPVARATYTELTQPHLRSSRIFHSALGGFRYAFVNGEDLRFEYLFQEDGYTEAELRQTYSALSSRSLPQVLFLGASSRRFARSGLELPGRHTGLASLRVPELFGLMDFQWYTRALFSFADRSTILYSSLDKSVGDHGLAFLMGSRTSGAYDSELKGLVDYAVTVGYRHAW